MSEDQFDAAITAAGHASASSSISGSDGSSSIDSDDDQGRDEQADHKLNSTHVVVRHPSGNLFLCWSSVFDVADGSIPSQQPAFWSQPTAVILCSGGHFAATLFERNRVIKSKTFHRYVVRAKQVSYSFCYFSRMGLMCIFRAAGRRCKIKKSIPAGSHFDFVLRAVVAHHAALFQCGLLIAPP
jgi:hypothetical protein